MIVKSSPQGFKEMLDGIELKNLTFGDKTHLTQVRLKKGSVLPEHYHPHEQTGYLISGKLKFFSGAEEAIAQPGDSWTFPSNMKHGAKAIEDTIVLECFSPARDDYLKL